tara:strand:- start:470 stop:652 length:183 start_codon:yes stop_codon:yes gene_type:complete
MLGTLFNIFTSNEQYKLASDSIEFLTNKKEELIKNDNEKYKLIIQRLDFQIDCIKYAYNI